LIEKELSNLTPASTTDYSKHPYIRHILPSCRWIGLFQEPGLGLEIGVSLSPIHGCGTVYRLPCVVLALNYGCIQMTDEDVSQKFFRVVAGCALGTLVYNAPCITYLLTYLLNRVSFHYQLSKANDWLGSVWCYPVPGDGIGSVFGSRAQRYFAGSWVMGRVTDQYDRPGIWHGLL